MDEAQYLALPVEQRKAFQRQLQAKGLYVGAIDGSVADLVAIEKRLTAKGVALKVITPPLDTSTSTGRLQFNIIGSVAQFEREIMLERQREGIQRAKKDGKYKGRKPTAQAKAEEVQKLHKDGLGATRIAERLCISRRSVYRCLESADRFPISSA